MTPSQRGIEHAQLVTNFRASVLYNKIKTDDLYELQKGIRQTLFGFACSWTNPRNDPNFDGIMVLAENIDSEARYIIRKTTPHETAFQTEFWPLRDSNWYIYALSVSWRDGSYNELVPGITPQSKALAVRTLPLELAPSQRS